ncbi:hypothetical protein AMECASPLE_023559, partial [Ameca splendens]
QRPAQRTENISLGRGHAQQSELYLAGTSIEAGLLWSSSGSCGKEELVKKVLDRQGSVKLLKKTTLLLWD